MFRSALTFAAALGGSIPLLLMLMGCANPADPEYGRIKALEVDVVPPLYQGSLTVEAVSNTRRVMTYSQDGWRRVDRTSGSFSGHSIVDPKQDLAFRWTNSPRDAGLVRVRPITAGYRATSMRWEGLTKAQRLGPCAIAGEAGHLYRRTRPANLKGPGGTFDQACITTDGVVLSKGIGRQPLEPGGPTRTAKPSYVATAVRRGPLPPGVFDVPSGLRRVEEDR